MSNIPSLNEMLKLHTKKDLWERIQHHIKTIDTLRQQLEEKDKEISKLQASCQQVKKQFAIQELSEVERLLYESHYKRIGKGCKFTIWSF